MTPARSVTPARSRLRLRWPSIGRVHVRPSVRVACRTPPTSPTLAPFPTPFRSKNSGTINVLGGDLTVNQSGNSPTFTPSFTNTGTIAIAATRSLTVNGSGGVFNYDAGTIGGAGTLS